MYSFNSGMGDVWFVLHVLIVVLLYLMLNFRRGMLCVGSGRNFSANGMNMTFIVIFLLHAYPARATVRIM